MAKRNFGTSAAVVLLLCGCGRISFDALASDAAPDSVPDATPTEPRCFEDPGGSATSLAVDSLALVYATPNSVRINWGAEDPDQDFSEYEVRLIPEGEGCDIRRYTPATNPGLGYFLSPTVGHPMTATVLDGLDPGTNYLVQLIGFERSGGTVATAVLPVRSSVPSVDDVVLFSEEDTNGYSIPATLVLATGDAYQGENFYEFVSACEPACFENLRRQNIGIDLGQLTAENFSKAYYEFALAASDGTPSYWSQARLSFRTENGSTELFVFEAFVINATNEYKVYQIPLSSFTKGPLSAQLTYGETQFGLDEFTVGGSWAIGSTTRLDEVRIRW